MTMAMKGWPEDPCDGTIPLLDCGGGHTNLYM